MGGAARAAIIAAIIALISVCASAAETPVSLVEIAAKRTALGVSVELHTSGQADFRLDRFALGDWVYIWSPNLTEVSAEQELSIIGAAAMPELLSGASLSSDGKRSGVRIYLGADADRRRVAFVETEFGAVLQIPARAFSLRDGLRPVGNPLLDQNKPAAAEPVNKPVLVSNTRGKGTIDYQIAPVIPPLQGGSGDDGVDVDPLPEDTAADIEGLPDRGQSPAAVPRRPQSAPRINTPSIGFDSQYMPEAQVSSGFILPSDASTKAELESVRIDLFEIVDQPLDQALTLLVAPTRYNIIVDSSVGDNSVSLSFKEGQTSLRSALDLLTRTYGLEYVVEAGTIVVAAAAQVHGQLIPWESRLFVLSYADPKMVRDMLINTAIVTEDQVEFYGGEVDFPVYNDETRLSETEGILEQEMIKEIETNVSSTPRNAVLVRGVPDQLERVAGVIATIDRKPKQIQLEVRVCEANEVAMKNLGISGSTSISQLFNEIGFEDPEDDDIFFEANQLGSMNRTGGLSFEATINLESSRGNVTMLAQPTLTTTEGKQAIFFAGESVPYVSQPAVNVGTNFQPAKVSFIKLGVILNFKPRLDSDGLMTIDMNPTVSSLLEFLDLGGGAFAPRIQSRQMANTIRVADGQSFVMSGLISEEERRTTTKVPLLGDIPVLGRLFRNKNTNKIRTEIIVLVTPRIVD